MFEETGTKLLGQQLKAYIKKKLIEYTYIPQTA
jgi:hypothetical protein